MPGVVHSHSSRYEAKRQEIEAWLLRMESRSERLGTAEAQTDVLDFSALDSQQKEQKVRVSFLHQFYTRLDMIFVFLLPPPLKIHAHLVILYEIFMSFCCFLFSLFPPGQNFHAELHTYKHHIELFNQLTQKLIAIYPGDDTSRIKRMTESVNLR